MDVYLNITDENEILICAPGEVDLANAGELLLRLVVLVGAAPGRVALDVEQVTFMDYCGLRTLSAIERHARSAGGSVRVAALSPQVARVLEFVGGSGALPWILATPARPRRGRAPCGPPAVDDTAAHLSKPAATEAMALTSATSAYQGTSQCASV